MVRLDGRELSGAISADIHANNHLAADRFRVRLAASATPATAIQQPGAKINVSIALDGAWTSLVTGIADSVTYDPIHGLVDLEGRDLSAKLIEARVDETFANRTASEVASALALRHGLASDVQTTSTPIGRYYQAEHEGLIISQFSKATTEWDFLATLAGIEGFDLFMRDSTLCFKPTATDTPETIARGDCIAMQLEHSLTLAQKIEITVRSWGTRSGTAVVETVSDGSSYGTLSYSITRPNLTADDARRLAQRTLSDLRRHEWLANITIPGELGLSPRSLVLLSGTGTEWDRLYSVAEISRALDVRRGFTERLTLQGVQ